MCGGGAVLPAYIEGTWRTCILMFARREELSVNFAKKAADHQRHSTWFKLQTETVNTRSIRPTYIPVKFRTERFKNSPLPYLTSLLNKPNQ